MPNGGIPHPTTHVTVIGLGGAGCRMLDAVTDTVARNCPEVSFAYVAIDSNEADMEREAPDEAYTVHLDRPDSTWNWEVERERHPYLTADTTRPTGVGTARSRSLGRYYCTENVDRLVSTLTHALDREKELDDTQGVHQVWVLYALGGGTGSGAAPLVATLVRELAKTRKEHVVVGGIGSLPRLELLEATSFPPVGNREFYLNSYAALRELTVLLDYDDTDPYPLEIDVGSTPTQLVDETLELDESPFDVYGLLGVNQERLSHRSYAAHKNQIVADAMCAFAGKEVFPDRIGLARFDSSFAVYNRRDEQLFSLDGGGVRVPVAELERLAEIEAELAELDEKQAEVEGELDAIHDALEYLHEVLSWRVDDDIEDLPFGERVRGELLTNAEQLSARGQSDLKRVILDLRMELGQPQQFNGEDIVTYVLGQLLKVRLEAQIENHAFVDRVDELCHEKYTGGHDELRYAHLFEKDVPPAVLWSDYLEPFLTDRKDRLEHELDATSFRVLRRVRLTRALEEVTGDLDELRHLYSEFEELRNARNQARERSESARMTIRVRRNTIEHRIDEKRETLRELDARKHRKQKERSRFRTELEAGRDDEYSTLPMWDLDALLAETGGELEAIAGLDVLLKQGYLRDEDIVQTLTAVVQQLEETTQDRRHRFSESGSRTLGYLTFLANKQNEDLLWQLDDELDQGNLPLRAVLDQYEDYSTVETAAPLSLYVLAAFAPIALELTSEFGTLHEYYIDPERTLSEQFRGEVTDEDVTECFAYPELFPNERGIAEYYGG